MTTPPPSQFLVTVCQTGAEGALKQEVAREHPDLRSAFARPGLVTFKSTGAPIAADFALRSVFARSWAAALGPAHTVDEVIATARRLAAPRPLRLHVWERDSAGILDEKPDSIAASKSDGQSGDARSANATTRPTAELRAALLAAGESLFSDSEKASIGDHAFDVITAGEEPFFLGHHVHSASRSPYPGGRIPVEVPADAPSRAYRKLEEALAWSGAPLRRGQVAVEIGSAPGGASLALLRRGLEVVGVDPGAMADVVLASPRFVHIRQSVGEVRRADLPARVDWLLLDVNLAPQVALHAIVGLVAQLRPTLRGVLLTLKLNDWAMAARIPDLLRRVEAMKMTDVRATQLPGNRQEFFAWGRREERPPHPPSFD